MDERAVGSVLGECEAVIATGATPDLGQIGFWRAVAFVKTRPELVARYADRIARIDRAAFRRRVRLVLPVAVGRVLVVVGLVVGLALLAAAAPSARPWRELLVLAGAAWLDVTTHGLAHLLVGTAVGIRFTDWFVDLPMPQPGFKIDYASYLLTPARARAWMHASGAIATKLTPFAVVPYALAIGADGWAIALIVAVGVVQIVTDVLWSVKASDWKKFRRELRFARTQR